MTGEKLYQCSSCGYSYNINIKNHCYKPFSKEKRKTFKPNDLGGSPIALTGLWGHCRPGPLGISPQWPRSAITRVAINCHFHKPFLEVAHTFQSFRRSCNFFIKTQKSWTSTWHHLEPPKQCLLELCSSRKHQVVPVNCRQFQGVHDIRQSNKLTKPSVNSLHSMHCSDVDPSDLGHRD